MTDWLVVSLLLIIIGILISVYAPEVAFWMMLIILVIIMVIAVILLAIQFINGPIGCISSLFYNNPISVLTTELLNSTVNMSQRMYP
jgi:hypothetical protein